MNLNNEIKLAKYILAATRKEILTHFQSDFKIEYKKDQSPVTIADQKSEEIVRTLLAKETPDYNVVGEEFGGEVGTTSREWVIDPIDGTKSFIHGVPLFGTLLALIENGKPLLGFMDFPALNIQVWAASGQGAFLNDQPCSVSKTSSIEEATLLDGNIVRMEKEGYLAPWKSLISRAKIYRGWGDCYGYYLVATGKAEVMVDPIVNVWDVAPIGIILKEAGGLFTSISGEETILGGTGIGSNGILHPTVVSQFNQST